MEGRLAEEINSKSLRLSKSKLPQASISNIKQDVLGDVNRDNEGNLWEEDESLSDVSPHGLNKASDLDREWQKRRDQFHTIGYRDGLIAGKETSAQEGFNIGFKQSVFVGCEWGIVIGVTSILASLPDELREKLINSWEKRNSFQSFYESVRGLSTSDALRLFNQDINERAKQNIATETSLNEPNFLQQNSDFSPVRKCIGEFRRLLSDSPSLDVHFPGYQSAATIVVGPKHGMLGPGIIQDGPDHLALTLNEITSHTERHVKDTGPVYLVSGVEEMARIIDQLYQVRMRSHHYDNHTVHNGLNGLLTTTFEDESAMDSEKAFANGSDSDLMLDGNLFIAKGIDVSLNDENAAPSEESAPPENKNTATDMEEE